MYCGAFMTVTYHDYPNPLFPLWDRERPKMAKKPIHFEKVVSSWRGSNPYPLDIRCGFSRCSQMMKKYHPEPLCYRVTFFEKKGKWNPFSSTPLFLIYILNYLHFKICVVPMSYTLSRSLCLYSIPHICFLSPHINF